jgi:hypothetical protein
MLPSCSRLNNRKMRIRVLTLTIGVLLVCGFGWFKKDKKAEAKREQIIQEQDLPAGYALLFKLLSDEKNVSKLLLIKRENRALHDLIKEISNVTGDAHKSLEKFGKAARLNLQDQQLPAIETATRDSISKEKAKQLFGAKGDDFQFSLLLTQNEALVYGRHLALALIKGETEAARKEFLESLAARLEGLQDRVMQMLNNNAVPQIVRKDTQSH